MDQDNCQNRPQARNFERMEDLNEGIVIFSILNFI
jgi:hypothetical protein